MKVGDDMTIYPNTIDESFKKENHIPIIISVKMVFTYLTFGESGGIKNVGSKNLGLRDLFKYLNDRVDMGDRLFT